MIAALDDLLRVCVVVVDSMLFDRGAGLKILTFLGSADDGRMLRPQRLQRVELRESVARRNQIFITVLPR